MTGRAGALASLMLLGTIVGMVLVERTQTARRITATQNPIARPRPTPTARPLPLAPPRGTIPSWLHTDGTRIVDAAGHPIRLASINWYGAEGATFVPGGLANRPYMDILRTIKYLGFNSIRYAFSNELVETNPVIRRHVDANPGFRGKRALYIMDTILAGARQVGLMVILADMSLEARGQGLANTLWYRPPHYTQQVWIHDWLTIAQRYRTNPAVVGFDLHNEPHSNGPGLEILGRGYLRQGATWGPFQGVDNAATDWRRAAAQAGNAILRVNPHVLIIVEGVEIYPYRNPLRGAFCPYHIPATDGYCADLYWWGGNLQGVQQYPVVLAVPHQLVYSPHEYGPSLHDQRWITPRMTERDWQGEMSRHWGYLLEARGPNAAPLWVGEFGTSTSSQLGVRDRRGNSQRAWFSALIDYLQRHRSIGWAYWPLNGTYPGGSRRETYGLLSQDWKHIANRPVFESLRRIQG
jgi:endoglucanase